MNFEEFDKSIFDAQRLIASAVSNVTAAQSPSHGSGVDDSKPRPVSAIRLLLIEDDELDAAIFLRTLQKQTPISFVVDRVGNMHEAIGKLQGNDYDIALVDINLPDASGSESFEQLNAFDARLPIVVLTGHDDDDLALQAIRCGAQDYISKGNLTTQAIVRTIRFAIVRQQMSLGFQAAAETDSLTGMPNRRNLDTKFSQFQTECQEHGQSLCISLIDIDHFKDVNDRYGHCVGDAVLRRVADMLTRDAGPGTWAGRFGGEEFALLIPDHDLNQAKVLVEAILAQLDASEISVGDLVLSLTASAGAVRVAPNEAWETAFGRCDKALYHAKSGGRNRVSVAEESPTHVIAKA